MGVGHACAPGLLCGTGRRMGVRGLPGTGPADAARSGVHTGDGGADVPARGSSGLPGAGGAGAGREGTSVPRAVGMRHLLPPAVAAADDGEGGVSRAVPTACRLARCWRSSSRRTASLVLPARRSTRCGVATGLGAVLALAACALFLPVLALLVVLLLVLLVVLGAEKVLNSVWGVRV